jgi:hypothetical protein
MIAWMMGMGSPHIRSGQYWLAYRQRSPKVAIRNPQSNVWETVERVHWDPFMSAEIGMPAPYDYGAQRAGWGTHLLTNWAGDDGWLAGYDFRLRGMNFLGDTLWFRGEVARKHRGRSGNGYVECSLRAVNQRGEDVMPATAVVALPTRDGGPPAFPVDHESDRP